jgi:hypothetical protein
MATPATPRTRRPGGTGNLYARPDAAGRESWYATWYEHGRKIKRRIGRKDGENGLSKRFAERELRRLMAESATRPKPEEHLTLEQAGNRLIERLRGVGRKPATLEGYESVLRIHLVPFFGEVRLDRITASGIEQFVAVKRADGSAPKTVRNMLALLNSIYVHAERHGLVTRTRCAGSRSRVRLSAPRCAFSTRPSWRRSSAASRAIISARSKDPCTSRLP